jgi:hypothetical protein
MLDNIGHIPQMAVASAWIEPDGTVHCQPTNAAHYDVLKVSGIQADYEDKHRGHDGAFINGCLRIATTAAGELSLQWGGKLTAAQRSAVLGLIETCTSLYVSAAQQGFDPEAGRKYGYGLSEEGIELSSKRAINQCVRREMAPHIDRYPSN